MASMEMPGVVTRILVPGNRRSDRLACPQLPRKPPTGTASRFVVTVFWVAAGSCLACAAELQPLLAVPGKVLFEDDFARDTMAPKWGAKGNWKVIGGVATADDRGSGSNGPSCKAEPRFVYHDVVVDFDFQFESTRVLHLQLRDKNYAGTHTGHICCLSISPEEIRLCDFKNGVMENRNYERLADKALSKEEKTRVRDELLAAHSRLHPFAAERGDAPAKRAGPRSHGEPALGGPPRGRARRSAATLKTG
jgi:hypothetical protein